MKNKIRYFENLRVFSVLGVIVIHAVYLLMVLDKQNPEISSSWWLGNIVQGALRIVVPIMFMQSGALLLSANKNESIQDFLTKRFTKVVLPFISWNIVYCVLVSLSTHTNFGVVLLKSVLEPVYYHLWFVYALIGIYLITPILRIYVSKASLNNIFYALTVWLLYVGVVPFIKKLSGNTTPLQVDHIIGYTGYFLLGYYIERIEIPRLIRRCTYLVSLISYFLLLYLTYYFTTINNAFSNNHTDYFFQEYLSITVIFMSIGFFLYAKNAKWLNSFDFTLGFKLNIPRICFGVYLSQSLVLSVLRFQLGIFGNVRHPIIGTFQSVVITVFICFGGFIVLDILNKFKLVQRVSKLIY